MQITKFGKPLHFVMNLTPLLGALVWGWTPFSIVFAYWLESLGIISFSAIKMMISKGDENRQYQFWKALWHFVKYTFILMFYLMFLVIFLGMVLEEMNEGAKTFSKYLFFTEKSFFYAMLSLLAIKVMYFYGDFIANKKYESATVVGLRKGASTRMITIHLVIILGFFSAAAIDLIGSKHLAYPVFAIVFVTIKAIVDYFSLKPEEAV